MTFPFLPGEMKSKLQYCPVLKKQARKTVIKKGCLSVLFPPALQLPWVLGWPYKGGRGVCLLSWEEQGRSQTKPVPFLLRHTDVLMYTSLWTNTMSIKLAFTN